MHDSVASSSRPFAEEITSKVDDVTIAGMWSDDPARQLDSTTKVSTDLSSDPSLTAHIARSGVLHRLVYFLSKKDLPELQLEAARVLTIIAAINPDIVVVNGAAPVLVKLMDTRSCAEQAISVLGVIAQEPVYQDCRISCKALTGLLHHLHDSEQLEGFNTF